MIRLYDFDEVKPEEILNRDIRAEADVEATVDAIIADVRARGDAALLDYAAKFDHAQLTSLQVTQSSIALQFFWSVSFREWFCKPCISCRIAFSSSVASERRCSISDTWPISLANSSYPGVLLSFRSASSALTCSFSAMGCSGTAAGCGVPSAIYRFLPSAGE